MNQILSVQVDNKKGNKKEPANIKSVLKFFGIGLVIFAIFLIAIGGYSIYQNKSKEKNNDIPQISVEKKSDSLILLKVNHNQSIKQVTYKWNEEEEHKIEGNDRKYIEEEIEIPSGTNTLTVTAEDINNKASAPFKNVYTLGNIKVEQAGANVKISVKSKKTISYITYRWDEQEEVKAEVNSDTFERQIETIKGTHTLTVVAVDSENNTEKFEKKVVGVTKPKISVKLDGTENYIITVTDEEALSKVEFETEDDTITEETTEKEFEYKIPLKKGSTNNLTIKAYNSNDIEAQKKVKCKIDE